jgi:hypothetical protein
VAETEFQWIATTFTTGEIIEDLTKSFSTPSVKKTLGKYQTTTGTLQLPDAPTNWRRATLPGATVLHCLDMQAGDPRGKPIWSGFITRRPRTLGNELTLSLATVEQYLDRRYVGDHAYADPGTGQNTIVSDLVSLYVATGSNGGIPIRVQVVTPGAGKLRTRTYKDISDKTVYSALTELMGVQDGPEWTIGTEWQSNPERLTFVLYVGDRIGSGAPAGLDPNAVFEAPGIVSDLELMEDYSANNSGNDFMATSTANGDQRPQSAHVIVADPDRPTFERRFTPSTSITNVSTLNDHAQKKASIEGAGSATLSMSAVTAKAPRVGTDWGIGDDVKYIVGESGRPVPAFPGGSDGTVRATGWQLDFGSVNVMTPILDGVDQIEES